VTTILTLMEPNAIFLSPETLEEECILAARHGNLVNKKFREGLSPEEVQELEKIRERMAEIEAPFYEPALRLLNEVIDRLDSEQRSSKTKGK
jgi:hypothetical protein